MITLKSACDKALQFLPTIGMLPKIYMMCSTPKRWLVIGRYEEGNFVEYGNNPISVDKKTGEVEVFSISDNMDEYFNADPVKPPKGYLS